MKEKLIELLKEIAHKVNDDDCRDCDGDCVQCAYENIADYLLENGVICPPCKVGDTVWFNTFKKNATVCVGIQPHKVERIDILLVCDTKQLIETKIYDWEIGERVFLTKEEAQKALEERKNK